MGLIKNKDIGKWTKNKDKFCTKCCNLGRLKIVKECDKEKFDELFDRYDKQALDYSYCYDRAIGECQYDYFYCPDCEEGQKYKDQYQKYEGK